MRDTSLRWGLGLGAVAAALGIVAQIVGTLLTPQAGSSSFNDVVRYLLIAGPLSLIALGVALGLAYLAGLRSERDLPAPIDAEALKYQWGGPHRDSALAGTVVMACYWLLTSLYGFVLEVHPGRLSAGDFLTQHVVQGVIFLLFGFGMGAMGGRAPAARRLLDEISVASPTVEHTSGIDAVGPAHHASSAADAGEAGEAGMPTGAQAAPHEEQAEAQSAAASEDEPAG